MEERGSEASADYKAVRLLAFGGETFVRQLLAQMSERKVRRLRGRAANLETDVAKPRIVRQELKQRMWQEADLAKRAKVTSAR